MVFLKDFFEEVNFKKKIHRQQNSLQNYPAYKDIKRPRQIAADDIIYIYIFFFFFAEKIRYDI